MLTAASALTIALMTLTPPTPPPTKVVEFGTDKVTVERLEPDPTLIQLLKERQRGSLIRLRIDFKAEIVRSASDV